MMTKQIETKCLRLCQLLMLLLLLPTKASADIGVPMIFITVPGMLVGLIPIILIECFVMSKQLAITLKSSLKASLWGNVVSTVIGIPITWVALVVIQICTGGGQAYGLNSPLTKFLAVTWQAPWLIPYDPDTNWMVPAATLYLLIPFFFVSWWIEYRVEKRLLKEIDPTKLSIAVRNANLVSYSLLFLIVLGWLITAIILL